MKAPSPADGRDRLPITAFKLPHHGSVANIRASTIATTTYDPAGNRLTHIQQQPHLQEPDSLAVRHQPVHGLVRGARS